MEGLCKCCPLNSSHLVTACGLALNTGSLFLSYTTLSSLAQAAAGQLGPMQLAMTPGASPSPPVSEYNASGKKRRFCGACQNHNLRTPVTFQHQQTCTYRHCPCNLCIKKRSISQAQVLPLSVWVMSAFSSAHQAWL
jgi:DM DNA binding domain